MENDVFSLNRFWRYLKSDFDAFISKYGITLLVLSTMPVTCDVFTGVFSLMNMGRWEGLEVYSRLAFFAIFGAILLISAPARLYGHLTDRKEGSAFLLLPVSRLEKYISMILITCIVMPFIFILIYLGLDVMVCMIDSTTDVSVFSFIYSLEDFKATLAGVPVENLSRLLNNFGSLANPYLYIDDIIQVSLIFLLGALIFKTSKTGKTMGSVILISMAFKLATAPILAYITNMENLYQMGNAGYLDYTSEAFSNAYPFYAWVWSHLALIDTIWDNILNCLLLFFVWLRLKRIKL
jgi:hypothetical protein